MDGDKREVVVVLRRGIMGNKLFKRLFSKFCWVIVSGFFFIVYGNVIMIYFFF